MIPFGIYLYLNYNLYGLRQKNKRSHPANGTRALQITALRGATHVRRKASFHRPMEAGRGRAFGGTRLIRPLGGCLGQSLCRGLPVAAPLPCWHGCLLTPAPSLRNTVIMSPNGPKVNGFRAKNGQKLALGLISRQARSPRARPWMSISAVATLVATGMQFWSQERSRSLIWVSF